jgi:hypothetical protein
MVTVLAAQFSYLPSRIDWPLLDQLELHLKEAAANAIEDELAANRQSAPPLSNRLSARAADAKAFSGESAVRSGGHPPVLNFVHSETPRLVLKGEFIGLQPERGGKAADALRI